MKKLTAVGLIVALIFCSISNVLAETLNDKNAWQDVKVFVINMERSTERRKYILDECKRHNLEPILFKAIDGNALSEQQLNEMTLDYEINGLTKGEIGCSLSHIGVYRKIVDENINLALILEDDVILNDNISDAINEISVFNDSTDKPFVYFLPKVKSYVENRKIKLPSITLYDTWDDGWDACGYIINYKAAKRLSNYLYPVRFQADEWRYFKYATNIKIYCVVPALVCRNHSNSTMVEREQMLKIRTKYVHKQIFFSDIKAQLKKFVDRVLLRPFIKKGYYK